MNVKPAQAAGAIVFENVPFALRYKNSILALIVLVIVVLFILPYTGLIKDSRPVLGGILFIFVGGSLFKFWTERTGKEFPIRQLLQWKVHLENSPKNPDDPFSKAYFLDNFRAYPVQSGGLFDENLIRRVWDREDLSAIVVHMAGSYAIERKEEFVDVKFVESFLAAISATGNRFPSGEKERIRKEFIREIADWIAFDPKNWNFGKNLHKTLKKPEFAAGGYDDCRLFLPIAASFFISKTPDEFASTIQVLSEGARREEGLANMDEWIVANMFFGLLSNAPTATLKPLDVVRFRRLFVVSQQWWKLEQAERAVEICLTGRFGPEIAEFAVPFVHFASLFETPKISIGLSGIVRGEESGLVHCLLNEKTRKRFHPNAVRDVSVILSDLGKAQIEASFPFQDTQPNYRNGKRG